MIVPVKRLEDPKLQKFKAYLESISIISKNIIKAVDANDECAVPFSAYDSLK